MKLAIDGRPAPGGIGRMTRLLIDGVRRRMPEDQVFVFGEDRPGPVGLPPWRRMARRLGGGPRCIFTDQVLLPAALRQSDADLFHGPRHLLPGRIDIPSVITLYDLTLFDRFDEKGPGPMKWYERRALSAGLTHATIVITISDTVRSRFLRRFPDAADRVTRIYPPPVGLETHPPPERIPPDLPDSFFLTVGTLEPRKNLDRLLDAQTTAFKESGLPLVLAGAYGWSQRETLRQIRSMEPAARWLGWVDDALLAELYRRATAVVQFSRWEGFDLPVAEALTVGAPLVLSDIPVHREVGGDCALYAQPTEVKDLVRALLEVTRWPEQRRAQHRDEAKRRLDFLFQEDPIEAHFEVYRRALLSANPPGASRQTD